MSHFIEAYSVDFHTEFQRSGDLSELYNALGVPEKNKGCSGDGSSKEISIDVIRGACGAFTDGDPECIFLNEILSSTEEREITIEFG